MLAAYGLSDPGCVRSNNEDYHRIVPDLGLCVLADGMGGAAAGEKASHLAVETVVELMQRANPPNPQALEEAFLEANRRVVEAASQDASLQGMGTTLLAVQEFNGEIHVVSVGDSRAYLCEEQELLPITEDQTWVNEVGRRLGIEEGVLKTHPMRHVLTMAVGVNGHLRLNHYVLRLRPEAFILMCSDGLHGVLDHATLNEAVNSRQSFADKCHFLIEAARGAGGPDNITVILVTGEPR